MLAVISHPDCLLHDMGLHAEQPARIKVIQNALLQSNFKNQIKYYLAPLATREQLIAAHDKDYIESIFKIAPNHGVVQIDPDTSMNSHTLTAALRAAGAVIYAVDLVMQGDVDFAFCNIRPPGHHAEKSQAMGFCFFNNVAIGVMHAFNQYHLQRVAIIDFDVHHGNGTEDIFRNDPRVLLCSSFQHPFYPNSGMDTHRDHILNLPLEAGTQGSTFREKIAASWFEKIKKFNPEMIFFSAGFDAHAKDPLANLFLQEEDYFWISAEIKKIADECCFGRMVSVLEGGYALEALGKCVVSHLQGLLGSS